MKPLSILSAALAFCCAATAAAQTPVVVDGQKVLLDKRGRIVAQPAPGNLLPSAPLVGGSDSCTTPDVVVGAGPHAFDTTTATTGSEGQSEAICFNVGQMGLNNDVWFTWTAGFTGRARLSLCSLATFDTKVAVYAGTACPTGAALVCNDDACALQSATYWNVTSGSSYVIQIGQWGTGVPSPGSFTIDPYVSTALDDCSLPQALPGPGTYTYDTTSAMTADQPHDTCGPIYKDHWYTYQATQNGMATLTTCGLITSTYVDTKLAVFDGASCPTAPSIVCDDDSPCATQSGLTTTVSWPTVCGQTYMLRIGQFGTTTGVTGSFDISETGGTPCGPVGQPYCFGDGTGTACPCANNGAAGNGCASSVNPNGGNLSTSGNADLGNDTLALLGSGMPNSTCLYFQGTSQISVVFGDGLRCAGGAVTRLGTKLNALGSSQYPIGADAPISVKGGVMAPGSRVYQVWYRNAAPFCTPRTFNLVNGILVNWM